jgi:FdhD protein
LSEVSESEDNLAIEEPLEIKLEYSSQQNSTQQVVSVTMRTPGNDEDLALGFLFTEGIIQDLSKVKETTIVASDNKVLVRLQENTLPILQKIERNFYTTSSCGVCGKTSIDAIRTVSAYQIKADKICLKPALLYRLASELENHQALFKKTGGLHASALFDLDGNFLFLREDVGRHNALDKVIGSAFLRQALPLDKNILLLSGRASFELIQKAMMAGIKIVAAVGAPSSLAVQLAEDSDITLIGFLRNKGFNIYSGERRILTESSK